MNNDVLPGSEAIGLSPAQFAAAFPFHMALGRDLKLQQLGSSLRRVAPDLVPGLSIAQSFDLVRPEQGKLEFNWIVANRSHFFLLRHRFSGILLRGEFVLASDAQTLVFLASPWLTDSSQLISFGLEIRDFAVHDPMIDLLLVMQFNKQALEDATELNGNLRRHQAELQLTNEQLSLQFKVAQLTSQAKTPIEAAAWLLEPICTTFGLQWSGLWVVREDRMRFASGWLAPEIGDKELVKKFIDASHATSCEPGVGLHGSVWSRLETAWVEDILQDPHFRRATAAWEAGFRSAIVFPILIKDRVWGLVELFSFKSLPLDKPILATLQSIGVQIGQAVERVEAQEQLRESKDQALALSAAKGKYVSTLSHEIRTPLNAVIGMTSVIKQLPMDRKLRDSILTIEQAGEQLLSIVNNVLDIDQMDAGAMVLDIVNFDVQNLVAHVMRIIGALPAAGALDVGSSIDPDVPRFLIGDQGHINQILINLLSNAVKFTPQGSVRLAVSAQPTELDRVRVRFSVQDTGIGIKRSWHEKIFEAFERVSTANTGTGLGLTICKEFAKRMGGELTLESTEGVGSTFTFSVPLQRGSMTPANEAQRLSALHALDVLDSAPTPALDELVAEAARLCQVPIALISLVDEKRQWFKAKIGLETNQTPREQAFCAQAILTPERIMVVPDAHADPRFSDNPLVTAEPFIRFYAGAPLIGASGQALGTLCVIDRVPRELSETQLAEMRRLANKAAALLLQRPLRVLVAEDTLTSQLVLRMMLEQMGHSVRVVGDGDEAVKAFADEPFDLVLLDVQMPVMDGLAAARAIRQREGGEHNVPIAGLSAYATQADRERALASGMTSYLIKPVKVSDLTSLIAELKIRRPQSNLIVAGQNVGDKTDGEEIERARLHDLAEQLGPNAMAAAVAQFELDARTDLDLLRSSLADDDSDQMRRIAHRLKGLFAQFGAMDLAGLSGELEQAPGETLAKTAQRILAMGPGAVAGVRIAANEAQAGALQSPPLVE